MFQSTLKLPHLVSSPKKTSTVLYREQRISKLSNLIKTKLVRSASISQDELYETSFEMPAVSANVSSVTRKLIYTVTGQTIDFKITNLISYEKLREQPYILHEK